MNTSDLSPYARGAMTFEEKRRLGFHVSPLKLHAHGSHPGKTATFRVWLSDRKGLVAVEENVPAARLFPTIEKLLADAGEPLPTIDQWASIAELYL